MRPRLPLLAELLAMAALLAACSSPLQVLSVTPATALDDLYQPVETTNVFGPQDTFFVSVQLRNYRPDMQVVARWRYEGQFITETTLVTGPLGDSTKPYEGYAGFSLRNDNPPWPSGDYTVEIVYQDKVLGSAAFRVEP